MADQDQVNQADDSIDPGRHIATPTPAQIEEFLEQLYRVQVERSLAAVEETAPEVIAAAVEAGLVAANAAPAVVVGPGLLTATGLAAARDVVRRHRLSERLLHDVLGVSLAVLNPGACEFEHLIGHGLDERICILLGHPAACPHGKPIPDGPCCRQARQDGFKDVGPLSEGAIDAEGTVAYLQTRDEREVQKLMALGILPGTQLRLLRRFPSFVFQLGYSQFTVDRELAEKVYVHWRPAPRT